MRIGAATQKEQLENSSASTQREHTCGSVYAECHAATTLAIPMCRKPAVAQAVYVHTAKNVLIEVNPAVRLPRTFKRFCGLMVQLLQKLSIRSSNGSAKLLRVSSPTSMACCCRRLQLAVVSGTRVASQWQSL